MFGSRIAYTTCMILATVTAGFLVRRRQSKIELLPFQKWGIAIGGLVGATFAAKLPFILGVDGTQNIASVWLSDGKTILWGLVGGYVGVEIAKWSLLVTTSTGDSFVIPVAVAIAIGRVGCLLFGCCFGVETDQSWGVAFVTAPDKGSLLRHPAQIYEMAFHVSFALLAWSALSSSSGERQKGVYRIMQGNWMPAYLISYAIYRFASEYIRPEARMAGGLTFYQWSSIVIACCFAVLLATRFARASRAEANQTPLTTVTD